MGKLKKVGIGVAVFFVVMTVFGMLLPDSDAPESTPTPAPTPTERAEVASPTSRPTPVPKPQHFLPLRVSGFTVAERSGSLAPIFDGEESSAHVCFVPLSDAALAKVENVCIFAYLFSDEASSEAAFELMLGTRPHTGIPINGSTAALQYNTDSGAATVTLLVGRLVIVSDAIPPWEWPLPDPSEYARADLEAAAIAGMKAARRDS